MSVIYPIYGCTQPILPTVLDDSLSYLELIENLTTKINELVAQVNALENVSNDYTDEQIKILKETLDNKIDSINSDLRTLISSVSDKENADYLELKQDIQAMSNSIKAQVDLAISQYNTWLMDYLSKQILDIKVINFFNGQKVSVQDMFDYLAQLHITNGLTYEEITNRLYTYGEIISICNNGNYTYSNLITDANTILPNKE